ncbi:TonB-dependent receptor [Sphingomonas bacterium]|uniref:TonB-dependent receptor n=1 Tax=Sphingomonas bacterium TaxID=1895847 RepID=UPI001574EF50|nr:TonB-dependent receptor [Sphingomonas bacterium]
MRYTTLAVSLLASAMLASQAFAQNIAPTTSDIIVEGRTITKDGVSNQTVAGGLMIDEDAPRVKQSVTRDYIAKQLPTANPEQLLALQPGANVTMGDPFGLSVGHLSVRGLDIAEIGWLFEGMPFNNGAVYPNEVVDSENLSIITLTPGSVDFDVPTFGAAGGLVELHFRNPSKTPGAYVNLAYGSYNFNNQFVRLDSGDIGNTGMRAFISGSNTSSDFWHGPGYNSRQHIDFKMIKEFDGGSSSALSVSWNTQVFALERWPTLAQWNASGLNWTYDRTFTPGMTTLYALHESAFANVAASWPNRIKLTTKLELAVTPYFFHGYGTSPGGAQLSETGTYSGPNKVTFLPLPVGDGTSTVANSATVYTPNIYEQFRTGVNAALNYHIGGHTFTVGYWYENDYASTTGVLVALQGANGKPDSVWASSGLIHLPNGDLYRSSYTEAYAWVNGFFISDRASLLNDRLEIDGGFKEVGFSQEGRNLIPGETPVRTAHYSIPLPTLAARYKFNDQHQIYANAGTNFLTPQASQLFDVYSQTTGQITQVGVNNQKAEYSIVEEIGYRYSGDLLSGSISAFNYNFRNRQIATRVLQNGVAVTQYINAGNQTSRGIDVEAGLRSWHHIRPFVSAEYLHAINDSNIQALNGDYLPTQGKYAVRSPKFMESFAIDYDNGNAFANVGVHHTNSQYSTFMNDEQIPSYTTANVTIGYRLKSIGAAKAPTIQLNLVNITNTKYLGGVYSTQYNALPTRGINGTTIAASGSPTYLPGAGFAAIVSVATSF